jgi:hypothetical protein
MAVDANRIGAVFSAALEAVDPVHQAAILDRECGSDTEMRQRVEALLRAHREQATIVDQPGSTLSEALPPLSDGPTLLHLRPDQKESAVAAPQPDHVVDHGGPKADEEPISLQFLEPSTKPGALGRLGHHEVLEVLDRGGFGIVVRAFDESLHRMVAIKVLSP